MRAIKFFCMFWLTFFLVQAHQPFEPLALRDGVSLYRYVDTPAAVTRVRADAAQLPVICLLTDKHEQRTAFEAYITASQKLFYPVVVARSVQQLFCEQNGVEKPVACIIYKDRKPVFVQKITELDTALTQSVIAPELTEKEISLVHGTGAWLWWLVHTLIQYLMVGVRSITGLLWGR